MIKKKIILKNKMNQNVNRNLDLKKIKKNQRNN